MKTEQHTLQKYPSAIANAKRALIDLEINISILKDTASYSLNAIEEAVAFDETLKNDMQRKAKKARLLDQDRDYASALIQLKDAEYKHKRLSIELELMQSSFSVEKLLRREAIAAMEVSSRTAA